MKIRNFTTANVRRMLLCALLCMSVTASASLVSCSGDDQKTNDSQDVKQSQSLADDDHIPAAPEETMTAEVTTAAPTEALPTEALTEPPADTEVPVVTEPDPEIPTEEDPVTDVPDETEPDVSGGLSDIIGMSDAGQFVSEQSKTLKLVVDWEYIVLSDGTAQVTVNIGCSHYRISSREKVDWGAVQVDGNAELFTTPAFAQEENTLGYTPFYSAVYTTDRDTMELEASWKVLGVYSGQEIDTLTTGGTITFGDGTASDAGSVG